MSKVFNSVTVFEITSNITDEEFRRLRPDKLPFACTSSRRARLSTSKPTCAVKYPQNCAMEITLVGDADASRYGDEFFFQGYVTKVDDAMRPPLRVISNGEFRVIPAKIKVGTYVEGYYNASEERGYISYYITDDVTVNLMQNDDMPRLDKEFVPEACLTVFDDTTKNAHVNDPDEVAEASA